MKTLELGCGSKHFANVCVRYVFDACLEQLKICSAASAYVAGFLPGRGRYGRPASPGGGLLVHCVRHGVNRFLGKETV